MKNAIVLTSVFAALFAAGQLPAQSDSTPPLPFQTIEGYGGGAITPIAYLVNPGVDDAYVGLPSAAVSYVSAGKKNLLALTASETLFGRLELSYGYDNFNIGTLDDDILAATGVDIDRSHVALQTYSARVLLIKEGQFGAWTPAITAGVHYKRNTGIDEIDERLGGALSGIGLDDSDGVDYTLTASKTIVAAWTGNRPLIVSAGLRSSKAAHIGLLGFSDKRRTTFEGNIVYLPTNWLLVAYEYRQKSDPYDSIAGLVGKENDWQAVDASWLVSSHATLTGGWARLGTLANTRENGAWFLQLKYEL